MNELTRESAVFVWRDRALFLGDRSETGVHSHHAVELSVALDESGLSVTAPAGPELHGAPGAVVRSNVAHQLTIPGPKVAVLYVDPRAALGLSSWLGERPLAPLPADLVARHRAALRGLFQRGNGLAEAAAVCTALLRELAPVARWGEPEQLGCEGEGPRRGPSKLAPEPAPQAIDSRVARVLSLLEERLDDPPTQAEAAAHVSLSASRLAHCFKQQVGLPMRRYVLWLRLRAALTIALGGASMTEAAHRAGFSDSAHFTRTCQRMFGLPPSGFAPVQDLFVAP